MTREEEIGKAIEERPHIKDSSLAEFGFKEGAEWQKQQIIEKNLIDIDKSVIAKEGVCGEHPTIVFTEFEHYVSGVIGDNPVIPHTIKTAEFVKKIARDLIYIALGLTPTE